MGIISESDVRNIAHLARVHLNDEEIHLFTGQIETVLEYIESLSDVDVEGVEPFLSAAAEGNVFRDDVPRDHLPRDKALANAPDARDGFFSVPAVQG